MFEHYTFGMQVNPSGPDEPHVSPEDAAEPMQCPSPALSPTTDLPALEPESPQRTIVDSLAQELSKQHFQLDERDMVPLQAPSPPSDTPISPSTPSRLGHDVTARAARYTPQTCDSITTSLASYSSLVPDFTLESLSDPKRLRRQQSSHFHNNPKNSRAIQELVDDMILTGSQCNVYVPPPAAMPPFIEPDDTMDLSCADLEVDEAYCGGSEDAWIDSALSLRKASGPDGVRKHSSSLRYRLSAEVALKCPNVVRSRPRMRRRKDRLSSRATSSIASSSRPGSIAASPALLPH